MHLDPRLLFGWTRDVSLAYAGGLVLGTPFALGAVWLTGTELAATACIVLAMTGLLVALRRTAASDPAPNPCPHQRARLIARAAPRRLSPEP